MTGPIIDARRLVIRDPFSRHVRHERDARLPELHFAQDVAEVRNRRIHQGAVKRMRRLETHAVDAVALQLTLQQLHLETVARHYATSWAIDDGDRDARRQ